MLRRLMTSMHAPIYESRLRELVSRITPHLRSGDHVLDVGCGGGTLGAALMEAADGVTVDGLERFKRGGEPIEVLEYDGGPIPLNDDSYDVVILADVLHHEEDPDSLLAECVRVGSRLVIIKDHRIAGPASWARVSFMDWAANAPYGVKCLYRYNTLKEWRRVPEVHEVRIVEELTSMKLYPPVVNTIFGGRLQYLSVLDVGQGVGVTADLQRGPDEGAAGA